MKKLTCRASEMSAKELAAYIDYSVLKPEFTEAEIIELTKDGAKLDYFGSGSGGVRRR